VFHVVRGNGFACGSVRDGSRVLDEAEARLVLPGNRCRRVGCANDYAKADVER